MGTRFPSFGQFTDGDGWRSHRGQSRHGDPVFGQDRCFTTIADAIDQIGKTAGCLGDADDLFLHSKIIESDYQIINKISNSACSVSITTKVLACLAKRLGYNLVS